MTGGEGGLGSQRGSPEPCAAPIEQRVEGSFVDIAAATGVAGCDRSSSVPTAPGLAEGPSHPLGLAQQVPFGVPLVPPQLVRVVVVVAASMHTKTKRVAVAVVV